MNKTQDIRGVVHHLVTLKPQQARPQVMGRRAPVELVAKKLGRSALAVWRVMLSRRDYDGELHDTRASVAAALPALSESAVKSALARLAEANLVVRIGYNNLNRGRVAVYRVWGYFRATDDGDTCLLPAPARRWMEEVSSHGGSRTGSGRKSRQPTSDSRRPTLKKRVSGGINSRRPTQVGSDDLNSKTTDPTLFKTTDPCNKEDLRSCDTKTSILPTSLRSVGEYPSRARARGRLSAKPPVECRAQSHERRTRLRPVTRHHDATIARLGFVGSSDETECKIPPEASVTWRNASHVPSPPPYEPNIRLPTVPGWPRVTETDDAERAEHLARAFQLAASRCFPGVACWVFARGDIRKSKHFDRLVLAAADIEQYGGSPEKWAEWAMEHWKRVGPRHLRSKPPGAAWVFSHKLIAKYRAAVDYEPRGRGPGAVEVPKSLLILQAKWQQMCAELDRVGAEYGSDAEREVVQKWFPGDSYREEFAEARREADDRSDQLRRRVRAGEWVW